MNMGVTQEWADETMALLKRSMEISEKLEARNRVYKQLLLKTTQAFADITELDGEYILIAGNATPEQQIEFLTKRTEIVTRAGQVLTEARVSL